MKRALALLLTTATTATATAVLSCGRPCRTIAVEPVNVGCQSTGTFNGEIHFDDVPTFQAFLESDQCLPDAIDEERQAIVNEVDFLTNALFVAVGERAQVGRCIEDRQPDVVEVCNDGLRIAFADRVTDASPCAGKWTVAFELAREDMRAAIDDGQFE